jgi:kynurenine formamidase
MRLFLSPEQYIDTNHPLDISLPLSDTSENPRAWYVDAPEFEPVRANGYIGSIKEGGSVNFRNIFFNPHGHGTHTECLGHITEEIYSINDTMKTFMCVAQLVSITPKKKLFMENDEQDDMITIDQLKSLEIKSNVEALILRTMPNEASKKHKNYSSTNPPYLDVKCIEFFNKHKIKHLLIDTPSVDRESDGGALAFHHAFWGVPDNLNFDRTITELIFVEDEIFDGTYILDLQVAPFENDAAPSRPVLYKILETKKG